MTSFTLEEALQPSTYPGATPELSDEMDSLQKAGQPFDIKVDDAGNKIAPKNTFSLEEAIKPPSPPPGSFDVGDPYAVASQGGIFASEEEPVAPVRKPWKSSFPVDTQDTSAYVKPDIARLGELPLSPTIAKEGLKQYPEGPSRPGPTNQRLLEQMASPEKLAEEASRAERIANAPDTAARSGSLIEQVAHGEITGVTRMGSGILDAMYGMAQSAERKDRTGETLSAELQGSDQYTGIAKAAARGWQEIARTVFPKNDDGSVKRLEMAKKLNAVSDRYTPHLLKTSFDQANEEGVIAPWMLVQASAQAPQFAMTLATFAAPAIAPATLPMMGFGAGGNQYAENIAKGTPQENAAIDAFFNGFVEFGTEIAGIGIAKVSASAYRAAINAMSLPAREALAASLLSKIVGGAGVIAGGALVEGAGEGGGQILQDLSQKYIAGRDPGDIAANARTAFFGSMLPGAGYAVHGVASEHIEDRAAVNAAENARKEALNKWETEGFHQNPVERLKAKPTPAEVAGNVLAQPTLSEAIDVAMATTRTPIVLTDQGEVYNADAPPVSMTQQLAAVEARTAEPVVPEQGAVNEHQAALNDAIGTVGPDGIALFNDVPVRAVEIDSLPDAADSGATGGRTSRQGAEAIRSLAGKGGVEVTFFADQANLPDGFVDPKNPNRLFVSDNPQRGMAFTAIHEFKHTTEAIKLPDGSTLNDQLVEAVHRGMTPEGRAYSFERFRYTLPANATQAQIEQHFANELSADIGGWAMLRKDFLPKMFSEIESRHGEGVVKSVMTKFINGITDTINAIKYAFKGQPSQQDLSTKVVSNLEEVHGILAKLYAEKFGGAAAENLKLESERVAAQVTKTTQSTGPPKSSWTPEQDQVLREKLSAANEAARKATTEEELVAAEKLVNEAEDLRVEKMASMGQETEIDVAAHEAATSPLNDLPQPTQEQKEAGNYKKGHIELHGLPISIENPVGSVRSGVSANGNKWSNTMKSHYGYIKGTVGKDKDHIDTFIGRNHESQKVFVVDQRNGKGTFDEHKVMLGFDNVEAAKQGYLENYTRGWKGMGAITPTSMQEFQSWLKEGDTTKPFAGRLQYSPKSYQQSAIKILEGEDAKKPMNISEVAQYFDKLHGPAADFTDPKAQARAQVQAEAEFAHQIKSQHTGLDWYNGDIEQAFKITADIIPYLAEGRQRMLFSVVAGIHSQQTKVVQNWPDAAESYQHYLRDGEFPPMNPNNGNYWATSSGPNKARHIGMVNNMIKDLGEDGFIDYMFSLHTTKELNDARARWGGMSPGVAGKMTDEQLGVNVFGPKVSEFIKNINGLDGVTVDKWMTRTFHRWFGNMADANGEIIDAPTEPERRVIKLIVNKIAVQYGTSPQSVQAALWYFEQGVFKKLGAGGDARGFSEAAKEFYQRETGNEYTAKRQGGSGDREAGQGAGEDLQFSPKVVFEVAPNPRDQALTDRWEALSQTQRIGISERVARTVIPDYLASIGATGEIMSQVGSYEDKTNVSFVLLVDGADPVRVAKTLGYALSQDSVIVMSDETFEGGERRGAVTIALGEKPAKEVDAIYQKLHAANPSAIGGQSYSDGVMTILNFSDLSDEELAKVVADGISDLEGHYVISHHEVFTSFLEGKDYDYDNQESDAGRNEEAVRLRENLVRQRVSAAIEREFAGVKQSPKSERPDGAGSVGYRGGAGALVQGEKSGAVGGTGVHYSTAPRNTLASNYYGTGYRGAELQRVRDADDARLQHRIYFYVDGGRGINPESGVGPHAHQAELNNIYDAQADALDLWLGRTANEFESAVLNAGFDGYAYPRDGAAVLLGQRSMPAEYLGMGVRPEVSRFGEATPSRYRQQQRAVQDNRSLPAGEMTGAEWKRMQDRVGFDLSHLNDDQRYYKDQIAPKPAARESISDIPKNFLKRIQVEMPIMETDGSVTMEKRSAKAALKSLSDQENAYRALRACLG